MGRAAFHQIEQFPQSDADRNGGDEEEQNFNDDQPRVGGEPVPARFRAFAFGRESREYG